MSLADAAYALDELAAGRMPDRARLQAGALAVDVLRQKGNVSRDFLDAAVGLETLATGGTLDLSESGRLRARALAAIVREAIAHG